LLSGSQFEWQAGALAFREKLIEALAVVPFEVNGDPQHSMPHIANVSFLGIDSEALIVSLQDIAGVATGSACTSASYTPSHVLTAMGLPEERILRSVRFSWWSDTDPTDLPRVSEALRSLGG
jgi:cysteine desulfurase